MPAENHPHHPSAKDPEWYRAAACSDVDVSVFYPPDNERGVLAGRRVQRAKQICERCPVIRICLTTALAANERHGVWGGLTPDERGRLDLELGSDS